MRVRIGDVSLFFDVEGAGLVPDAAEMRQRPTLLLLHGGPGFDHSAYKPEFGALADLAQVIYLDHRGNGRSDKSEPARWELAQWADDVVAFCRALEIERPIVLGNSFGGMVAMAYATRHPEHPGKLILSSTAARTRMDRVLAEFERLGGPEAREVARRYWEDPNAETASAYERVCLPVYNRTPGDPNRNRRVRFAYDVMFHFGSGEERSFDLLPALGRVRCPTLVLAGEDDPITPVADSEDIVAALPADRVRFERFAGCGHGVFRDAPERAMQVIREFIVA